jgi:hypothetical protein
MRARYLFAAGLVTAVLAACSKPSAEAALDVQADLMSEVELALASAANAAANGPAVVSDLELGQQGVLRGSPATPPARAQSRPNRSRQSGDAVALLGQPVASVATVHEPVSIIPVQDVQVVGPVADASGGAADEGPAAGEGRSRGGWGGIIIRGGGTGNDPCVRHGPAGGAGGNFPGDGGLPGAIATAAGGDIIGAIGVLINNRAPQIGRGGSGYPTSRGRPLQSTGGAVFRGGIR